MALERTIKIKVDSRGAKRSIDSLDRSVVNLGDDANKTTKDFGALKASVLAVGAALNVAVIVKYADAFTSIQNTIRQTTTGTKELTDRTAELLEVANRSRVGLKETSDLYQNLVLSTEDLNLSTEKQIRLTETIVKSFAVSGKSAAESAGAIVQLGQAFSAGALRGDEFNSIAEGAPEIMRALQRSLGLTQGKLRDFAATGGITAKILVEALDGAASVIDQKLSEATVTLSQSMQIAENNAIAFVGASDLITTSMGFAGESIISASENLDVLANALLVAAVLGFGRLNAMLILNTVEFAKNTIAKVSNATATKAVNNGINFTTASLTRQTLAMRLSTIAATGLKGAMALLGGPIGVVTIAAVSLGLWIASGRTAAKTTKELSIEVDELALSFSKLNEDQIHVKLTNATTAANQLERSLFNATKEFNLLQSRAGQKGTSGGMIDDARMKVEALRIELEEAIVLRDSLFQAGLSVGRTPTSGAPEKVKTAIGDDKVEKLIEKQEAEQQALFDSMVLFEEQKTRHEQEAADKRVEISDQEFQNKIEAAEMWAGAALSINAAFGSKSEKAQKKQRRTEAVINGAAGIARAWADLPYWLAVPATVGIAANVKSQIDTINSSGSNLTAGGGSISGQEPQRQEPIGTQSTIQFRGLEEVAELLRNMDPQEPIPVEFAMRITAGMQEAERIGGGI